MLSTFKWKDVAAAEIAQMSVRLLCLEKCEKSIIIITFIIICIIIIIIIIIIVVVVVVVVVVVKSGHVEVLNPFWNY